MELIQLINRLVKVLNEPLPGRFGQEQMAPIPLEMERFDQQRIKNARKGAVLLLFCPTEDNKTTMVPFIKRATYEGIHSGQIALPGGKMDPEDQDLRATALRETEEEIGVERKEIQILGTLSDIYIPPSNFSVRPYIGYCSIPPVFTINQREVEQLITCSFGDLADKAMVKRKTMRLSGGLPIEAPYYEINQEVVWGATAMILSEFLILWNRKN
jgi:8-oxo-dGTP pyrophosphatase MutT (NUDIX family)